MIKAIFFDFDGTISDTRGFVSKRLIKFLEREEYAFDKNVVLSLVGEQIEHILKILKIDGQGGLIRRKFYDFIVGDLPASKLKLCVSVKPISDLKKKYLLIVISNADEKFIKKQAKFLGVDGLFKEIFGVDGFETKDVVMKKLFVKYKLKPREVIYVGDRFSDIEYARKAGTWAVAIHNKCSWSSRKVILAEKPDFMIKDFSGLKKVVEKINRM